MDMQFSILGELNLGEFTDRKTLAGVLNLTLLMLKEDSVPNKDLVAQMKIVASRVGVKFIIATPGLEDRVGICNASTYRKLVNASYRIIRKGSVDNSFTPVDLCTLIYAYEHLKACEDRLLDLL